MHCVIIGYAHNKIAYRIMPLQNYLKIEFRDIVFLQNIFKGTLEHVRMYANVYVVLTLTLCSSFMIDSVTKVKPRKSMRCEIETSHSSEFYHRLID